MEFSRNQIGIAAGAGVLLLIIFFGYLIHLNGQGPVLDRSDDRDPLSGIPNSISLNPLRDRTSEREAAKFIRSMRDGNCKEELADWCEGLSQEVRRFHLRLGGPAPAGFLGRGGLGGHAALAHPSLPRQAP